MVCLCSIMSREQGLGKEHTRAGWLLAGGWNHLETHSLTYLMHGMTGRQTVSPCGLGSNVAASSGLNFVHSGSGHHVRRLQHTISRLLSSPRSHIASLPWPLLAEGVTSAPDSKGENISLFHGKSVKECCGHYWDIIHILNHSPPSSVQFRVFF